MSVIRNSIQNSIPTSYLLDYIKLYKEIGEGKDIIKLMEEDYKVYNTVSMKKDIESLFLMYYKDNKLSQLRIDQIIDKRNGDVLKSKDEILLRNLRDIFEIINKNIDFRVEANEFINLSKMITKDTNKLENGYKTHSKNEQPYRERLDNLCKEYQTIKNTEQIEILNLNASFIIDFLYLSPFRYDNELVALIAFYAMLKSTDIKVFKFMSYFELLKEKEAEYLNAIKEGFHYYNQGISNGMALLKVFIDISYKGYKNLKTLESNTKFDKQLSKDNIVRSIIIKLPDTFTKDDIRAKLPNVSITTIERTLTALQEEGIISSIGRGRGAKWLKLDDSFNDFDIFKK